MSVFDTQIGDNSRAQPVPRGASMLMHRAPGADFAGGVSSRSRVWIRRYGFYCGILGRFAFATGQARSPHPGGAAETFFRDVFSLKNYAFACF